MDLNLKVLKERNIRNIIVFVTLLAIGLIFILWSRYRLKQKTNEELVALNTELEHRVEERTKRLREENERDRIIVYPALGAPDRSCWSYFATRHLASCKPPDGKANSGSPNGL